MVHIFYIFQHFFGMLRFRGGLNNHPESTRFAQLYRLMSIYSLVKPTKGSNVTGGEICHALVNAAVINKVKSKDVKDKIKEKVKILLERADQGDFDPNCDFEIDGVDFESHLKDVERAAVGHMAGFIAKTAVKKWCSDCNECKDLITSYNESALPHNLLIFYRSYGYLHYPSKSLYKLISSLEEVILGTLHEGLEVDTLFTVMDRLLTQSDIHLQKVGCEEHQQVLSEEIMYYYITTRMYFASRVFSKINNSKTKSKELAKKSKLVT